MLGAGVAAVLAFGILPNITSFLSLCLALGLALVSLGFLLARARNPLFYFAASVNFLPMLSITNGMTYDASQFWNGSSAILAGIAFGAVATRILPPLSPAIRTRRLLALTLADLRRLAKRASPGRQDDWESRGVARLLAMPDEAEPVERAGSSRQSPSEKRSRGFAVSRLGSSRARPWTRRFKRWLKDEAARRSSASRTSTADLLLCPHRIREPHRAWAPGRPPGDFRATL